MLRIKCGIIVGISLLAASLPLRAQDKAAAIAGLPANQSAMYSLDQFGPVSTPAEAEATFQKASTDLIAAGGGVIVIPAKAAAGWLPKNNTQHELRTPEAPAQTKSWKTGPGVTVIDSRGSTTKVMPPQADGMVIERTLNLAPGESLPHWGYYPMLSLKNTIVHGSTSYHDWLQEDVKAGKDQKFYVATIRGIFPGEFVNGWAYGGSVPRLCVKSLGYDKEKKMWYFVADSDADVQKGALISNKNHVNVLSMETFSHTENQTFDVRMWRHNYSQGDNYLFDARFKYMSDVHSTAGDENGVLYAAFVEAELNNFHSTVETWNAANNELKYKPSDSSTLGTGRPLINLNPAKWVTQGKVMIVQPAAWTDDSTAMNNPVFEGKTYPTTISTNKLGINVLKMGGLIHFTADAPVTDEVVGRYFAIDEASEYIAGANNARRWYLIDSITKNADGTKDMRIIRHWWGAKSMASPTLYKAENSSYDGHLRPLKYVIAPGANVYDVADAVGSPKAILRLAPTPFTGTPADFAPGDAVEQAIGPDPFKPISFRTWVWDAVPGAFPSPIFDVANNGQVMRDTLFYVHGGTRGGITNDLVWRYDNKPPWDRLFTLDSTCNTAIKFGCDVGNAALLFTQPNNRVQPIKWYYGTDATKPPKEAVLTVTRDSGELNFAGGGVRVNGPVSATGLSGGDKAARNLRGLSIPVPAGNKELVVKFPQPEVDNAYMVVLQLSWLSNQAVVNRTAEGFTVQFATPPSGAGELSWLLVR